MPRGRAIYWMLFVSVLAAVSGASASPVQVWLTDLSTDSRLEPQDPVAFDLSPPETGPVIAVDETRRYQTMLGFGASFTDSSAFLVGKKLDTPKRQNLMRELFDAEEGIGLSIIRQPLGASDFAVNGNYSYDDQLVGKSDSNLTEFSVAYDDAYIIPVLREALAVNPEMQLMGSPWSPPGWMKTTDDMVTGSLEPNAYASLAAYFVAYIEAYSARGVPTHFITPNNEPLYEPSGYPGMLMTPSEQLRFIRDYLGPALERTDLATKILAYDHNWDVPSYPETIFADNQAASMTSGTAWHCYGGEVKAQTVVHNAFPEKEAHLTECSGGEWQGTAEDAFAATLDLVIHSPREWSRSVILWNMALDGANGPTNGGCLTCRGVVTVSQRDQTYEKTVDYYALGHASKFVRRGAVRIGSSPDPTISNVAFANPDGSKVLIAHNTGDHARRFRVTWGSQTFAYTLAAHAAITFVWQGIQDGPTPKYAQRARRTDISFRSVEGRPLVLSYGKDLEPYSHQLELNHSVLSYTLPVGASLRSGQSQALSTNGWHMLASASAEDSTPSAAFDNDRATRWASGKSQANGDWLELDLGQPQTFDRLTLDAGSSAGDFIRGYQLYGSNDGERWGNAFASGPATGQTLDVTFGAQQARYLRIVATVGAGNWWSVAEARLYRSTRTHRAEASAHVQQRVFTSPSGQQGLAFYNPGNAPASFDLPTSRDEAFRYTLPPHAAAIFTGLEGKPKTPRPLIRQVSPTQTLPGGSITLTGRHFGAFQGISTVKFGNAIAPISAWSDSAITATIPADVGEAEVHITALVGGRSSQPVAVGLLNLSKALPKLSWRGTASASADGEPTSNMFDSDLATRWSTGAPQTPGQRLTIDFGRQVSFSRLVLDSGPSANDYARSLDLEVSQDGKTWQTVLESVRGQGSVLTFSFASQDARYMRLQQKSGADSWWSVAELYMFP